MHEQTYTTDCTVQLHYTQDLRPLTEQYNFITLRIRCEIWCFVQGLLTGALALAHPPLRRSAASIGKLRGMT